MKTPSDGIVIVKNVTRYFLDGKRVSEKKYRERHPLPESGDGEAWRLDRR